MPVPFAASEFFYGNLYSVLKGTTCLLECSLPTLCSFIIGLTPISLFCEDSVYFFLELLYFYLKKLLLDNSYSIRYLYMSALLGSDD